MFYAGQHHMKIELYPPPELFCPLARVQSQEDKANLQKIYENNRFIEPIRLMLPSRSN